MYILKSHIRTSNIPPYTLFAKFLQTIHFLAFLLARKLFPDVMPSKYTLDYAHIRVSNIVCSRRKIINSSRKILKKLLYEAVLCTKVRLFASIN